MIDSDAQPATEEVKKKPPHPWAELAPEHSRLLRLAPLSTDRATDTHPLRFVQLDRVERHSADQSLLCLSIQVPGLMLRKEQNLLEIWANHRNKKVCFDSDAGFSLKPLNRGLGRSLLAQAIAWMQRRWAHYKVGGGALALKDGLTEDVHLRRDHFIRAQSFDVSYKDQRLLRACYNAGRVSELHSDWHKDKVQIVPLLDAAAMLEQAEQTL